MQSIAGASIASKRPITLPSVGNPDVSRTRSSTAPVDLPFSGNQTPRTGGENRFPVQKLTPAQKPIGCCKRAEEQESRGASVAPVNKHSPVLFCRLATLRLSP